jgi:hypothetical protein
MQATSVAIPVQNLSQQAVVDVSWVLDNPVPVFEIDIGGHAQFQRMSPCLLLDCVGFAMVLPSIAMLMRLIVMLLQCCCHVLPKR